MIAAAITHHVWATRLVARNNPRTTKRRAVSQEHMDVNVNSRQVMSLPVLFQVVAMAAGLAVTYSTMVANDREHATAIAQLQRDVTRVQQDQKDLKVEILNELRELRTELRERKAR